MAGQLVEVPEHFENSNLDENLEPGLAVAFEDCRLHSDLNMGLIPSESGFADMADIPV